MKDKIINKTIFVAEMVLFAIMVAIIAFMILVGIQAGYYILDAYLYQEELVGTLMGQIALYLAMCGDWVLIGIIRKLNEEDE